MKIKPLRRDLSDYLKTHNLQKKFEKAKILFEQNIKYPSLNTELLHPPQHGIYSFRLDRKFRTLFFIDGEDAEVFQITNHYKK